MSLRHTTQYENTFGGQRSSVGGLFLKELNMLKEQDVAPDFELLDDTGKPTKLSDFRGKRVVLYFFPKAMTSG